MVDIRAKGQRGEREFLDLLSPMIGLDEKLTRNLSQTRGGGEDCNQLPGYAIEIKNQKTITVGEWWKQTIKQAKNSNTVPVLAYKVPRKGWLIVIPFSWLIDSGDVYPEVIDTVQLSLYNFATLYRSKVTLLENLND